MTRASDLQHGRDMAKKTPPTPKTCATCANFAGATTFQPFKSRICSLFEDWRDPDDGCIKGWTPK